MNWWKTSYGRLNACRIDQISNFCKVCKKAFSIRVSVIGRVKHHGESQKLKYFLKSLDRMQVTLVPSKDSMRFSKITKWDLVLLFGIKEFRIHMQILWSDNCTNKETVWCLLAYVDLPILIVDLFLMVIVPWKTYCIIIKNLKNR